MAALILVVEDEPAIVENILYALETEGLRGEACGTLAAARTRLGADGVDLLLLDVGLPDGNGFEFFREMRGRGLPPVIFLTARGSEVDRVVGLELGGDDYIVKPFAPRELTARIRAVLRRCGETAPQSGNARTTAAVPAGDGPFRIDDECKEAYFRGKALGVSPFEYRLLGVLLARPGKVFTRDELLERAWTDPGASLDRAVDAHIKNLRAKIHRIDPRAQPIVTHRGYGYSYQRI